MPTEEITTASASGPFLDQKDIINVNSSTYTIPIKGGLDMFVRTWVRIFMLQLNYIA